MNFILKNKFLLICTITFLSLLQIHCGGANDSKTSAKTTYKDEQPIPKDKDIFEGTPGKRGGKMVFSLLGNIDTFNPFFSSSVDGSRIITQMYASFFTYRLDTMEQKNHLVKSYTVSDDRLTYTFSFREGVRWSDGTPFTVDDVIFSFSIVKDKRWAAYGREGLMNSKGEFPEFKKVNDFTIEVKITEPNVLFESALSNIRFVPKHKWEQAVKDGSFQQELLINANPNDVLSLGPYRLKSFKADQSLILERNPHYWRFDKNDLRLPYLDKLMYLIVPDTDSRLVKFRNDETDFYELSIENYDLLKRDVEGSNYNLISVGPSYTANWITFNQHPGKNSNGEGYLDEKKLKLFSDKRFRQAASHGIDRKGMVNVAFHSLGYELYTFNTPANKTWFDKNATKFSYDVEKAKTLLKEIGLKDVDQDGYFEFPDGSPLKIKLITNVESKARIQMGNLIKDDFKQIGLNTSLQPIPFTSLTDKMSNTHDFDAVILGWGAGVPPDPLMSQNILLSKGRLHVWHPQQKEPFTTWEKQIDELYVKMKSLPKIEDRKKVWFQISNIFVEQQAQIMLVCGKKYVAVRKKIKNFKPVALPYPDWNTDELFIKDTE